MLEKSSLWKFPLSKEQLKRWKSGDVYDGETEMLKARYLMWHLTLTHRLTRNTVTESLYWFGRSFPDALFKLSIESLRFNDPYITERMLAVAFGITTALISEKRENFETLILHFSQKLFTDFFSESSTYYSTHFLLRTYAQGVIEAATVHGILNLSTEQLALCAHPFGNRYHLDWQEELNVDKETSWLDDSPLDSKFENYTIGRIVKDRSNYDFSHEQYRAVRAKIIWRAGMLGWKHPKLAFIDRRNYQQNTEYRWDYDRVGKTDSYKRKYSQIAYQEMTGVQLDLEQIELHDHSRFCEIDIDPSFPSTLGSTPFFESSPLETDRIETEEWLQDNPLERAEKHLSSTFDLSGHSNKWILLNGRITEEDRALRRYSSLSIKTFFIDETNLAEITKALLEPNLQGSWYSAPPEYYYIFHGEFYWSRYISIGDDRAFHYECGSEDFEDYENIFVFDVEGEEIEMTEAELRYLRYSSNAAPAGEFEVFDKLEPRRATRTILRKRPIINSHRFEHPVGSFVLEGKESSKLKSIHGPILDPRIVRFLNLQAKPQTFDLFKDGNEAFKTFRRNKDFPKQESEVYSYLRKDLLAEYLSNRGLVAIALLKSFRDSGVGSSNVLRPSGQTKTYQEFLKLVRLT